MTRLPGISGSLFPGRFLADQLLAHTTARVTSEQIERRRRHLEAWWRGVSLTCGPATGVRALFDVAAMPLFGTLGYRARDASFHTDRVQARLETPAGTGVGLVVLPWAQRPSAAWREVVVAARGTGADWCFLVAPPFVSLVDARGHASRRSVDFALPDALRRDSFFALWVLCSAPSFDRATLPAPPSGPHAGRPSPSTID